MPIRSVLGFAVELAPDAASPAGLEHPAMPTAKRATQPKRVKACNQARRDTDVATGKRARERRRDISGSRVFARGPGETTTRSFDEGGNARSEYL